MVDLPNNPSNPKGPPPRPPILPPTINESILVPKQKMRVIREQARKRLKKFHRKFEKIVRKYFKKLGKKDRYLQFYDSGYRFEAVFCELTSDGLNFDGEAISIEMGGELVDLLKKKLNFPSGEDNPESIGLYAEKNEQGEIRILQLIAEKEEKEIQKLAKEVENAPRQPHDI